MFKKKSSLISINLKNSFFSNDFCVCNHYNSICWNHKMQYILCSSLQSTNLENGKNNHFILSQYNIDANTNGSNCNIDLATNQYSSMMLNTIIWLHEKTLPTFGVYSFSNAQASKYWIQSILRYSDTSKSNIICNGMNIFLATLNTSVHSADHDHSFTFGLHHLASLSVHQFKKEQSKNKILCSSG